MWKKYYITVNLTDALSLLDNSPDNTRIIAGSTDLILEIKRGLHPEILNLIDISRIAGLDSISLDDADTIHIGALVTHNQIVSSTLIREKAMCLAEASWQVGSPQIRNRGTVVGNVVTASPANDTIPALIALGAEAVLVSIRGHRKVKIQELFAGVRKTLIGKNEILHEILIPAGSNNQISTFYKFALRNAQAISLINAATSVELESDSIKSLRIAVGAVAPTVIRLPKLESTLIGKKLSEIETLDFSIAEEEIRPISDIRSSDLFRREMVKVVLKRCFEKLTHDEIGSQLPDSPITLAGTHKGIDLRLDSTYCIDDQHPIVTRINGSEFTFLNAHRKSLLDLIREDARLVGSKEGCAEGECGACTVHMDGKAVMACLVPAPRAHMAEITTIEGISDGEKLHPVQDAFITEGAIQCGYCTPGFVMSAVKLLEERKNPDPDEIKEAITGNLCRCTGYYKIIRAIETAAAIGGKND